MRLVTGSGVEVRVTCWPSVHLSLQEGRGLSDLGLTREEGWCGASTGFSCLARPHGGQAGWEARLLSLADFLRPGPKPRVGRAQIGTFLRPCTQAISSDLRCQESVFIEGAEAFFLPLVPSLHGIMGIHR